MAQDTTKTATPMPPLVAEPLASQLTAFGQELAGDLQIKLEGPIEQQVQQAMRELDVTDTNSIIFYGKSSELASNRRDEQEMSVLCLRICQAAIVYINVLMIQDVLADPDWDGVLTVEDERGLTPLFWSHVLPYGEVKLNMSSRLTLGGA